MCLIRRIFCVCGFIFFVVISCSVWGQEPQIKSVLGSGTGEFDFNWPFVLGQGFNLSIDFDQIILTATVAISGTNVRESFQVNSGEIEGGPFSFTLLPGEYILTETYEGRIKSSNQFLGQPTVDLTPIVFTRNLKIEAQTVCSVLIDTRVYDFHAEVSGDFVTNPPIHIPSTVGKKVTVKLVSTRVFNGGNPDEKIRYNAEFNAQISSKTKIEPEGISVTNTNNVPILTRVVERPWDVNEDNVVDIFDLVLVGKNFMKSGAVVTGDVNLDSTVDLFDLVMVAKHFGETYGTVTAAAPTVLASQAQAWVSMSAERSTSRSGGLQRQLLDLEVGADVQTSIAGYQLDVTYDPRLLLVVGFENGNLLGEGSFSLDPQMTPGRIGNIGGTQLGASSSSRLGQSSLAKVSFRLKGDINLALASIGVGNLVVADERALPVPFELNPSITVDLSSVVAAEFGLGQNYPNPFNPETWIPYQLASSESVLVRIYDASGHLVRQIDVGLRSAGSYTSRSKSVYWDGRNEFGEWVASGVYYYQIQAGEFSATSKMLLLK